MTTKPRVLFVQTPYHGRAQINPFTARIYFDDDFSEHMTFAARYLEAEGFVDMSGGKIGLDVDVLTLIEQVEEI
jgi:hypothetical protein